jgi:hypothetical protein
MFKGYKTVAFNLIMTVLMMISLWLPEADLPEANVISQMLEGAEATLTTIWGVGNMILRAITDSPIFKS